MKALSDKEVRQVAALPYRLGRDGRPEVLLVTSRDTGRWIVPKGWPMKHLSDHDAAAQEALEEAGVRGRVAESPIGSYLYWKRRSDRFVLCHVAVFPLRVEEELESWREKGQRETRWYTPEDAAYHILEPDLAGLILALPGLLAQG